MLPVKRLKAFSVVFFSLTLTGTFAVLVCCTTGTGSKIAKTKWRMKKRTPYVFWNIKVKTYR